jgi:hypothetical protein
MHHTILRTLQNRLKIHTATKHKTSTATRVKEFAAANAI